MVIVTTNNHLNHNNMIGDMVEAMSEFCLGFTKEQIALSEEKLRQKEEEEEESVLEDLNLPYLFLRLKEIKLLKLGISLILRK